MGNNEQYSTDPEVSGEKTQQHPAVGILKSIGALARAAMLPFQKSIRTRFHYMLGFTTAGLIILAAITIISGQFLIASYDTSIKETRVELDPSHKLQILLYKVDREAGLYATSGISAAHQRYLRLNLDINKILTTLTAAQKLHDSAPRIHSHSPASDIIIAHRGVQSALRNVFKYQAGTKDAISALSEARLQITPLHQTISEFHDAAMQDFRSRLETGHKIADFTIYLLVLSILIGFALLNLIAFLFSRSILEPVGQLVEAADRLGNKDFSHRVKLKNTRDELGKLGNTLNFAASSLQHLYIELEQRSTHDGLTGVLNRATFDERLAIECDSADRHHKSLSLLLIDIDFFKQVNDEHGHQAGDKILKTVAQRISDTTRSGDIVARYGGEEFVVVLPETGEDNALLMAERIRHTIQETIFSNPIENNSRITVSLGCAERMPHTITDAQLITRADISLYRAKNNGRNQTVSASQMILSPIDEKEENNAA